MNWIPAAIIRGNDMFVRLMVQDLRQGRTAVRPYWYAVQGRAFYLLPSPSSLLQRNYSD
jgi:hypothetical protein